MSRRSYDKVGRWRGTTVSFRVSPEESVHLNHLVAISGLTKQDYIIKRLFDRAVVVLPNSRVQKALEDNLLLVYLELRRIGDKNEISRELEELIASMTCIFKGFGIENDTSAVTQEQNSMRSQKRE